MNFNNIQVDTVLSVCMIAGVMAAAIAGALRGVETKMDITGIILLAFLSANAGGTFRDLVLGAPVFWVHATYYLWISLLMGVMVAGFYIWKRAILTHKQLLKMLVFTDAMGLGAFSIAGVEKTLSLGYSPAIAILMGVWTSVGGGIVADVVSNRSPAVFSNELYIIISLIGSGTYLILCNWFSDPISAIFAVLVMISFRVIAVQFNIKLLIPKYSTKP